MDCDEQEVSDPASAGAAVAPAPGTIAGPVPEAAPYPAPEAAIRLDAVVRK